VGERIVVRYRQFVLIARGVSIFVVATTFAANNYPRDRIGALAVILVVNVLLWRIYIGRGGELLTTAIANSADPSRLSQVAAAHHLVMVAGIVATSVMGDLVVSRPFGDTPANWAAVMVAGPALFLIGRGLFDYMVFRRFLRSRWIGLVLLIAPALTAGLLPPIGLAVVIVVILALIASMDLIAIRWRPLPVMPPGR
jgi:low temperature requirement protein LtrA